MVRLNSPCNLTTLLRLLQQEGLELNAVDVRADLESLVHIRCLVRRHAQFELAVSAFPRVLSDAEVVNEQLLLWKDAFLQQRSQHL